MLYNDLKSNFMQNPHKKAIIHNNNIYSYKALWVDAKKIAHWLNTNLELQARVGIMLDNSYETIVAMYGILMSNRICVPIDTDAHERNIKYFVEDASISAIFTSSKYVDKVEEVDKKNNLKIVLTDSIEIDKKYSYFEKIILDISADQFEESDKADDSLIAFILYTTGTTGPRKGVILSHANLLAATNNINRFMQIGAGSIESLPMRLSHSFGFARLRCVFNVGGTVILEHGFLRPDRILNNMKLYKANAISSVPAGFSILLDYYYEQFESISPQIKYIEIGSALMRENHKKMLMDLCPKARICMHYGLTEASRSTFIEFNSEKDKLHSAGKPSPKVELRIISEKGEILGLDQTGEILVKGQMVMAGYWNKDKLTKENLKNGWLYTGDLGSVDDEGYLYLLGRKKEIINVGGLKIAPGEVEEILLKYDGIVEAAVLGVKSVDNISDEMIKAFIITDDDEISIIELEKFCLENMESYKLPTEFKIVEFLPKTASGKIQRDLLILKDNKKENNKVERD